MATTLPSNLHFSWTVLWLLTGILLVSTWVFFVLTRQWTNHRPIHALLEWARDRRFKLRLPPEVQLPASLHALRALDPQVQIVLSGNGAMLIRMLIQQKQELTAWHLLVSETATPWDPAGLRPFHAERSLVDLFTLEAFPSLLPPERFVVHAVESKDARRLARSPARGLLPADIGLLLHGQYVTLDFSSRPFDAIEFERMLTIMKQVVAHLR